MSSFVNPFGDSVRPGTQDSRSYPMIPTDTARCDGPMPMDERKRRGAADTLSGQPPGLVVASLTDGEAESDHHSPPATKAATLPPPPRFALPLPLGNPRSSISGDPEARR